MELSLKLSFFWLFITLETNVLLTMIVICGLKVLLWEAGRLVGRVLEELELKPTQLQKDVSLGLELSFAISLSLNKLTVNNVTTFSHSFLRHSWRNEGHKKIKDFQM